MAQQTNRKNNKSKTFGIRLPEIAMQGLPYQDIPLSGFSRAVSRRGAVTNHVMRCFKGRERQGRLILYRLDEIERGFGRYAYLKRDRVFMIPEMTYENGLPLSEHDRDLLAPYALAEAMAAREGGSPHNHFQQAKNLLEQRNN